MCSVFLADSRRAAGARWAAAHRLYLQHIPAAGSAPRRRCNTISQPHSQRAASPPSPPAMPVNLSEVWGSAGGGYMYIYFNEFGQNAVKCDRFVGRRRSFSTTCRVSRHPKHRACTICSPEECGVGSFGCLGSSARSLSEMMAVPDAADREPPHLKANR